MAVAVAIGGGVSHGALVGTTVDIRPRVIDESRPLRHHPRLRRCRATIAGDPLDLTILQALGDARRGVTGIQANCFHVQPEAAALTVQALQIGNAVMHVGRSGMGIGDDPQSAVDRAVR